MNIHAGRTVLILLLTIMMTLAWQPGAAQEATPAASPEALQPSRAVAFYPEETGQGTFITVELEPGKSAEEKVVFGNDGDIEQTLRTYAVPARSAMNGGFVLADYGVENDEITDWLDYPETEVTFKPSKGDVLSVKITVPEGTPPGEYVTGLAAEQADAFEVPGSDMIRQRVRWSVPILVIVPGERQPSFTLGDPDIAWYQDSIYATIGIQNDGNVTVKPKGDVRLLDQDGTVVGVARVDLDSIYSGTETSFVVAWENPPVSETYSVQAMLEAEDGEVKVEQEYADVVPTAEGAAKTSDRPSLEFSSAEFSTLTDDTPPSMLMFEGEISNAGQPIEQARVSIVTYKDGAEVDRYPIMQAVTIESGTMPVEARYSLPGGFAEGTYTFDVTIETADGNSQTVLLTHPLEFTVEAP